MGDPEDLVPKSFSAVDAGTPEDQRATVEALDRLAQFPAIRRLKAWSLEQLDPQPGMTALDVGCGTGEDTQGLAVAVAPGGQAVGVDASGAMVAEARRRAERAGTGARFEQAPAEHLPVGDASVDIVRCERVLQHVQDTQACVAEMNRALRPGGRIALVDTDWRSLTFWPGDSGTTARIRDAWAAVAANPAAGAQLLDLLARTGFAERRFTAEVLVIRSADRPPVTLMAANAVRSGTLTQAAVDHWHSQAREAVTRGGFVGMVTMTAASARRPN